MKRVCIKLIHSREFSFLPRNYIFHIHKIYISYISIVRQRYYVTFSSIDLKRKKKIPIFHLKFIQAIINTAEIRLKSQHSSIHIHNHNHRTRNDFRCACLTSFDIYLHFMNFLVLRMIEQLCLTKGLLAIRMPQRIPNE